MTAIEDGLITLKVVGSNSLGDHVIATATLTHRRERLMPGELSGKAAIVGIGATDFSKNSGRSELRLAAEAVLDALDDAGSDTGRRRRHGHVHDGLQHRGRHRAGHRHRGAEVLLQDPSRRRRGVRDGPAGGDRGGDRRRGLRCRVPGFQRALGHAVRPGADCGWWRTPTRRAWTTRSRIRTACPRRPRRWR